MPVQLTPPRRGEELPTVDEEEELQANFIQFASYYVSGSLERSYDTNRSADKYEIR